jgi:hypothetical protein
MSNCTLVVTTLECIVSGRPPSHNPPIGPRFAPCGYLPARGFFSSQCKHTSCRLLAPRLTQLSFFKYNQTIAKAWFLPVFEGIRLTLNLI